MHSAALLPVGLGAGNTGDDLMYHAFWQQLPASVRLRVGLVPGPTPREPYPSQHEYVTGMPEPDAPGLIVGTTVITESENLEWPLEATASLVARFRNAGQPVDALGVGVDRLYSERARQSFRPFLDLRSWTVRSHASRDALLELGVPPSKVVVSADWAWLYESPRDYGQWATDVWTQAGVSTGRPILCANVVRLVWTDPGRMREYARAFDQLGRKGWQIAFLCNESRAGDSYDEAAALEIKSRMEMPSTILPREYYSPGELIALLSSVEIALAERYHFAVAAVLAGSVPAIIERGQKMRELASDLGLSPVSRIEAIEAASVLDAVERAHAGRGSLLEQLRAKRVCLAQRARRAPNPLLDN